jgi:hypothetical protein
VSAPRHERFVRRVARQLGVENVPEQTFEQLVAYVAGWEGVIEASARSQPVDGRILLHADRCTTEPTTMDEDEVLRPLIAPGEVALALRPFPETDDAPAVVLYGSPEQLVDLFDSCGSFVEDVTP